MYHQSEFEDAQNQKSAKYTERSILEMACTQEQIQNMSEAEVSSLSSFSLEMPPGDSLFDCERSNPASDISQEDTGDLLKDDITSQENQHFTEENFVEEIATHDSDLDYLPKEESSANINESSETGSEPASWDGKKSLYSKKSLPEKDSKEPLTMEGLHLQDTLHEMPKEDNVSQKNSVVENTLFEAISNKISKENEFSVRKNSQPAPEDEIIMQSEVDTFAGTQKSLLDCIVRACSKEVALFLTQPANSLVRSLIKRHSCPDRINFSLNKDILNASDKTSNDIETKAEVQKQMDFRLAEKQQFDYKYDRVVNEVKTLQEEFEKKQDETQNLELCVEMIKKENLELQQQILRMGNFLHVKSDECINLSEENTELRRNLNKLLCKVKSYEEIIQCADRRLEVLSSQVSQLEKRNHYLETLNKKTKGKSINGSINGGEMAILDP
ncbi:cancer-associated gene 1 protein [Microcaecilia unicolor]|uniref:Cancer-associated gene 1 protein n=1 Tax=Microcaecilia unicolor TaxID=1415580 RepID=A0A6P7YIE1_9AMPH|nr:cancer-associated gene 1 protein [Microcaecilia unicolor]